MSCHDLHAPPLSDQRFFASSYGRFNTADPYRASGGAADTGSWNRYAYVGGDPVNYNDGSGLAQCSVVGVSTRFRDDVYANVSTAEIKCESEGGMFVRTFSDVPFSANSDEARQAMLNAYGAAMDAAERDNWLNFGRAHARATLMANKDCFDLVFGGTKLNTMESALARFDFVDIGTADLRDLSERGAGHDWAQSNGVTIQLNSRYFPAFADHSIRSGGSTYNVVEFFNLTYGTDLSAIEVTKALILHEMGHLAQQGYEAGDRAIDRLENKKRLAQVCG